MSGPVVWVGSVEKVPSVPLINIGVQRSPIFFGVVARAKGVSSKLNKLLVTAIPIVTPGVLKGID